MPLFRLGVVSFLNARPLVAGLERDPRVRLSFDVPARLATLLEQGAVDAALLPVVDLLRARGRFACVSDACIASDGETMTVRVFSHVPPEEIRTLWADVDSHTSVALAQVLWHQRYGRALTVHPFNATTAQLPSNEAVLLIGDKVVQPRPGHFAYEVDLGAAWLELTGLPFVFAVWAAPSAGWPAEKREAGRAMRESHLRNSSLAMLLCHARDRGVAHAAEIAELAGPPHGWPVELARRYLTVCLRFRLDERAMEGADHFARLCSALALLPAKVSFPPPWLPEPAEGVP